MECASAGSEPTGRATPGSRRSPHHDDRPSSDCEWAGSDISIPEAPADSLARQDLVGLKRVGRDVIARRLEQHRDIARVRVTGGYERRIEIAPDAGKLAIHRIGIDRIGAALRASNVALSGGMIRHGPFRYAVEVSGNSGRQTM